MKELIFRVTNIRDDVEILSNNLIKNEITEKYISYSKLLGALTTSIEDSETKVKCEPMEPQIIGYGISPKGMIKRYIINQPSHKRYVTYSVSENSKACNINFPNCIYDIIVSNDKISEIMAYMYLEWKGNETKLYKYAMPNMLNDNRVCIGQAGRQIDDGIIQALERIIYAPYSHALLNNIKSFSETTMYFDYLQDNEIEEKHLYDTGKKLKDLF